jgi:sulfoxide reductase heme-binding subunit YedZ
VKPSSSSSSKSCARRVPARASSNSSPDRSAAARAIASRLLLHPASKPVVFALSLLPFAWLLWAAITDNLGANPQEHLIRSLGDWTLRFLCITLAITPLRVVMGLPALARLRRMFGLFTYFYVVLHLLAYSVFDKELVWADIAKDIGKRPFILVGFAAFVLLTPLAATSFNRAVKALGAKRWQALHKAVYAIAGLAILHFFWMRAGKNNFAEVALYAAILALLLGWRAMNVLRTKARAVPTASGREPSRVRG